MSRPARRDRAAWRMAEVMAIRSLDPRDAPPLAHYLTKP
jgi:hypothetical protein